MGQGTFLALVGVDTMRGLRRVLGALAVLAIAVAALVSAAALALARYDAGAKYPRRDGTGWPRFTTLAIPGVHVYASEHALPFMAGASLELGDHGAPALFLAGGWDHPDRLYRIVNGEIASLGGLMPFGAGKGDVTYGAAVMDVDGDGRDDLFLARRSGIWFYHSVAEGSFEGRRLDLDLGPDSSPLSIALADLNGDGLPDLYVSCYLPVEQVKGQTLFNDPDYGAVSRLFVSDGPGHWRDATQASGLFERHNSFQAIFADLDGDGRQDLVAARDTGQVRTWRNLGGGHFEPFSNPSSGAYAYPMGIGAADVDGDGRLDLFFSNTGSTVPGFMARGDLRPEQRFIPEWFLFHNDGSFHFTDMAEKARLARYEFAWGGVFADLNDDGRPDLVVAENYVQFPLHRLYRLPGRLLMGDPDGGFSAVEALAGASNPAYEISPVIADLDGDGRLDLLRVNLAGTSVLQRQNGGLAHWLELAPPDSPAWAGAVAELTLPDGSVRRTWRIQGQGICSDSSHRLRYGLGEASAVRRLRVRRLGAPWMDVPVPGIDRTIWLRA